MSASAPTLPPLGQRHDREDAEMHDEEGLADEPTRSEEEFSTSASASMDAIAVEIAVVGEDVMDTTPDTDQRLVLPNGSASEHNVSTSQSRSSAATSVADNEADSSVQTDSAAAAADGAVSDSHFRLQSVMRSLTDAA